MSDLIDREAALNCFHSWVDQYGDVHTPDEMPEYQAIEALPSAQPEIIRCRDCRHWYTGDGYNHENGAQCALTHMWMSPDDYCSYGRREVSETDG